MSAISEVNNTPDFQSANKAELALPVKGFSTILSEMAESGEIDFDESDLEGSEFEGIKGKLFLPSLTNVTKLVDGMKDILDKLFTENGFSNDPPVEVKYSYESDGVKVISGRDDAQAIEDAINSDPDIKEYIRTTLAITSHFAAIQDSLQFQEEYRASSNPEAVVAKYYYLFDGSERETDVSVMYGSEAALLSKGQVFMPIMDDAGGYA